MGRLEAQRQFEGGVGPQGLPEGQHRGVADEPGVAFDDEAFEGLGLSGDGWQVLPGDRAGVEERPGIVELEPPRRPRGMQPVLVEGDPDLFRNRADGHGFLQRVAPQVAHQAAPRAFPVGEEDREDRGLASVRVGFRLPQPVRRTPRIEADGPGDALAPREDPGVAAGPGPWVGVGLGW